MVEHNNVTWWQGYVGNGNVGDGNVGDGNVGDGNVGMVMWGW